MEFKEFKGIIRGYDPDNPVPEWKKDFRFREKFLDLALTIESILNTLITHLVIDGEKWGSRYKLIMQLIVERITFEEKIRIFENVLKVKEIHSSLKVESKYNIKILDDNKRKEAIMGKFKVRVNNLINTLTDLKDARNRAVHDTRLIMLDGKIRKRTAIFGQERYYIGNESLIRWHFVMFLLWYCESPLSVDEVALMDYYKQHEKYLKDVAELVE